jgi:hypothetical protein
MTSTGRPSPCMACLPQEDARDNALVAVAAGELVADRDVAQLRDSMWMRLMMPLSSWCPASRENTLHADDAAALAVLPCEATCPSHREPCRRRSSEEALFRRELGLALRSDLADEDVAGAHFRADADDAVLVEVAEF